LVLWVTKPNAEPRKSGLAAHAVSLCCVGALRLYAAERRMKEAEKETLNVQRFERS